MIKYTPDIAYDRAAVEELKAAIRKMVLRAMGENVKRKKPSLLGRFFSLFTKSQETNPEQHLIILPDISDSTSAASVDVLVACTEYCEDDDRAVIVIHENGVPRSVHGIGTKPEFKEHSAKNKLDNEVLKEWVDALTGWHPGLALAFGDAEAEALYRMLAEGGYHLIWLDSFNAKHGIQPIPVSRWRHWGRLPLAVWRGVNTARKAAQAIRQTAKRIWPE